MPNSFSDGVNESTALISPERLHEICCARLCVIFMMALTFSGFALFLATGLYYMLIVEDTDVYPWYIISSIISLSEFLYLVFKFGSSLNCNRRHARISAHAPLRVPLAESLRTLILSRSLSDGVLIDLPGHPEPTLSLPVQIMISMEDLGENAELRTSTKSTENVVKGRDEESVGSTGKKADVQLSFGEVKETVVKVVDETLNGKGIADVASDGSSELPAEARNVDIQSVRQRKQSPMEPQKYVPLPEGEKTE